MVSVAAVSLGLVIQTLSYREGRERFMIVGAALALVNAA